MLNIFFTNKSWPQKQKTWILIESSGFVDFLGKSSPGSSILVDTSSQSPIKISPEALRAKVVRPLRNTMCLLSHWTKEKKKGKGKECWTRNQGNWNCRLTRKYLRWADSMNQWVLLVTFLLLGAFFWVQDLGAITQWLCSSGHCKLENDELHKKT